MATDTANESTLQLKVNTTLVYTIHQKHKNLSNNKVRSQSSQVSCSMLMMVDSCLHNPT
uniref:Uncharacterized protein n=1 Tax=Arion vulgaris TaxID=1028688 RepID=A0A0B6ZPX8_9EUPU